MSSNNKSLTLAQKVALKKKISKNKKDKKKKSVKYLLRQEKKRGM